MFKRRVGTLAATGITIVAAALLTLGTTAASAATATASAPASGANATAAAHGAVSQAPQTGSGCVAEQFSEAADQDVSLACVEWEQILLNDLWDYQVAHPNHEVRTYLGVNQLLSTDGYYGPDTTSDVTYFQTSWQLDIDGITGPQTWGKLCSEDSQHGFTGKYWLAAGCNTL